MQVPSIAQADGLAAAPSRIDLPGNVHHGYPDDQECRCHLCPGDNRQNAQGVAQDVGAAPEKNPRRTQVVGQETEAATQERQWKQRDTELAQAEHVHKEDQCAQAGDSRGQAIQPVEHVHRVGHAGEPSDGDGYHQVPLYLRLTIGERIVEHLDKDLEGYRAQGGQHQPRHLCPVAQIEAVIQEAQHPNYTHAEKHAGEPGQLQGIVSGKAQGREGRSEKRRIQAESTDAHNASRVLSAAAGRRDQVPPPSQPNRQGRQQKGETRG